MTVGYKKLGLHLSEKARKIMKELQRKHTGDPNKILEEAKHMHGRGEINDEDLKGIEDMVNSGMGINEIELLPMDEKIDAMLVLLIEIRDMLKEFKNGFRQL